MNHLSAAPASPPSSKTETKASHSLVLKNANTNENTVQNGKLVSTLKGNVLFEYDSMNVRSNNAVWWRDDGIIKLNDSVKVSKQTQILTCDRMVFYKNDNLLNAAGRFYYRDGKNCIHLTGQEGRYELKNKFFTLSGAPQLMKFDTAAAETLIIHGRQMTYSDTLRIATAKQDVTIDKGRLASTCRTASYLAPAETAKLRGDPHIAYEGQTLTGDSIDLVFFKDTLKGVSVTGNSHGVYKEKEKKDTNVTTINSDSMYMALRANGTLDSIRSFGNVRTTYCLNAAADTANQVAGKTMILAFSKKGDIDQATVWGNARSVYYVKDNNSTGVNEASGDSIRVFFNKGTADRLVLTGNVRGKYYPKK